ncbi:alpha/beta fold hydrolase [Pseudoduganella eburnea]|uniref:Alpha/beta fold hydrolase n=1 Tax=Massilia eburnea TaxID=1776165 RepID=A0A6L6QG61_9BURK|nr:alpha/beta hydrolase [Massilia eburnea]MTW11121.1 alpha/beta fold hydrolase [Massilia eburnea]
MRAICLFIGLFLAKLAWASGISSMERVRLGGVEQAIGIHGEDTSKPLLLILHGGPGFSELLLFRSYNRGLERDFVVVNWDQRGAGLSFDPQAPASSLRIGQIEADAHELVTLLKQRFGRKKIFLLGHSWGTVLGTMLARDYPEDFYAYVGVGQVANLIENEKVSLAYVLDKARQDKNAQAIRELEGLQGRYPSGGKQGVEDLKTQRNWLLRYGGVFYGGMNYRKMFEGVHTEEEALYRDAQSDKGEALSLATLWPELLQLDLTRTARTFQVPVYFLLGRADFNAPWQIARNYFDQIEAPHKALVMFERSGHFIPFEEPAKFNQFMHGLSALD